MASRGEYGALAFGRCVGTSFCAFCVACGQARKLLRISSGAKSFAASHVPASRPTTSRPACANGSAATPPTAPMPMMTTSVGFRLVAIHGLRFREHEVVVRRLVIPRCRRRHVLLGSCHIEAHARVANQIPS